MTEVKLVRIKPWRPLSHRLASVYADVCKQKQEEVGYERFSFLSENETNIQCKVERDRLLNVLKKRYKNANLSIVERNIVRRRFNEWQRRFKEHAEHSLRLRIAFCLNLITEEELKKHVGESCKRLSGFEHDLVFTDFKIIGEKFSDGYNNTRCK